MHYIGLLRNSDFFVSCGHSFPSHQVSVNHQPQTRLPVSNCTPFAVSCGPPPQLPLAQIFGRPRLRYAVDTVLRYRCREGLAQRNLPLIRCQENGLWEAPQISCVPRRPVSDKRKQVGASSYLEALGSRPILSVIH